MGSEARARLGFAALLFMVLLSLEQVFASGAYAGPAFLSATVATLLAMGLRRFGVPAVATLIASAVGLVWYLVAVFRADRTFFLLPTPNALGGVWNMIERAYLHSQIDYAPVPTRAGYVAMIVIAFWVMATLGEVATFRWRRPLLAALGPIALFALILVVGTRAMGNLIVPFFLVALMLFLGLESSHRLRTWGQWVATWRGRKAEEPYTITAGLARRMGAACVVVALAAPVFLPSIGQGLLSWRNAVGNGVFQSGSGGGLSGRSTVDPLVSMKSEFLDQTETELFRVRSERPLYWRLITLTEFDGIGWTPAETEKFPAPTGAIASDLLEGPVPETTETVEQRFELTGLSGLAVPAAYMPVALDIDGDVRESLEFDPKTADLQLGTNIPLGMTYTVQSVVPRTSFDVLNSAQPGDLGGVYSETGPISPAVRDLLEQWTGNQRTPFEKLLAIQTQLRGFDYSTAVDSKATSDYLARFLLETRAGYCQQFATAFTVLARMLGYEARVSVGFLPGETSPAAPDRYIVRGTDAHAWPEVYFEGLGWITFEPTPREEASPPGYTNPEVAAATTVAGIRGPENRFENPGPGGRGADDLQDVRDPQGGARRNVGGQNPNPGPSRWELAFERLLTTLLVVVLVALFAMPLLKELRSKRRYARARDARSRATAAFLDFEDAAGDLASPRHDAESALAYARRIATARRIARPSLMRLANIFEAAQYAPRDVSDQEVGEARRLARELKRNLWSEATWWERGARLFSPGRLIGS